MSTSQKRHFRCTECGTKTSTVDRARAAIRVCVRCRSAVETAPRARSRRGAAPALPAIERVPGSLAQARELMGSPDGDFEGFRRKGFAFGYIYEEPADAPGRKVSVAFAKRRLTGPQFVLKFTALHRQGKLAGTRVTEVALDPATPGNREPAASPPSARATAHPPAVAPASGPDSVTVTVRRKKVSALDAAAQVLQATGLAMTPKEIMEAILDRKLWASRKGKTPEFTIGAAMGREIAAGGAECRFVKAGRGKFAASAAVA